MNSPSRDAVACHGAEHLLAPGDADRGADCELQAVHENWRGKFVQYASRSSRNAINT